MPIFLAKFASVRKILYLCTAFRVPCDGKLSKILNFE